MEEDIASRIDKLAENMKRAKKEKKPQIEASVIFASQESEPWNIERWQTAMARLSRVSTSYNIKPKE